PAGCRRAKPHWAIPASGAESVPLEKLVELIASARLRTLLAHGPLQPSGRIGSIGTKVKRTRHHRSRCGSAYFAGRRSEVTISRAASWRSVRCRAANSWTVNAVLIQRMFIEP